MPDADPAFMLLDISTKIKRIVVDMKAKIDKDINEALGEIQYWAQREKEIERVRQELRARDEAAARHRRNMNAIRRRVETLDESDVEGGSKGRKLRKH
jgi:DNA repair exonuclease SbcCD ATPase subunit